MKARFSIDTEFNEFGGDLISLALVDIDYPDKKPFYEVLECRHPGDWVSVHVMPILNKPAISIAVFQRLLAGFLSNYSAVHIIADWPDDIKYFCQALITGPGTCIQTPSLSFEIRRDIDAPSELPHNALADAHGIAAKVKELERHL